MPKNFDATRQLQIVWDLMVDGEWRSLAQIAEVVGEPEASVSARLRDFRKPRCGAHNVFRRLLSTGMYEYRVVPAGTNDLPPVFEYGQVINALEKLLKKEQGVDYENFKLWKNTRLSLLDASKDEVLEAQRRLQPFVLDLDTRQHYGDGRELHFCHTTGAALMQNGEYKDLRHGDGIFMEATINNLQSNFNSPRFGQTRIEVAPEGLIVVMDENIPVSASTREKWNGKIVVRPDHSVKVRVQIDLGTVTEISLYGLLVNSTNVQLLLIKHQNAIKNILLARALKSRPDFATAAGV